MLKHVSLLGTLHIQITPVGKLTLGTVWYLPRVMSMTGERRGLGNMGESVSTTPDSLPKVLEADHPTPALCVLLPCYQGSLFLALIDPPHLQQM